MGSATAQGGEDRRGNVSEKPVGDAHGRCPEGGLFGVRTGSVGRAAAVLLSNEPTELGQRQAHGESKGVFLSCDARRE